MSRPVIPPSRLVEESPTTQALSLLQRKLRTAEVETVSLVNQLADFGFPADVNNAGNDRAARRAGSETAAAEPVAPFLPATADAEVLRKNYEVMVARLCRTESQLQTLKLNLCALQAERNLSRERTSAVAAVSVAETTSQEERLAQLKEEHEDEVRSFNKEIARARNECREALDCRNEAEEESRRLDLALQASTTTKTELALAYEELISSRQKLIKKNAELREELAREGSLHASLEDSHNALLDRIRDMEGVVESERQEVQILSEDCSGLRREGARILEEKKHHVTQLTRLQEAIKTAQDKLGGKEIELAEVQEENRVLVATLNGVKRENVALRSEMQNSQTMSETTERLVKRFEEEMSSLHVALTQARVTIGTHGSTEPAKKPSDVTSLAVQVTQALSALDAERTHLHSQLANERERRAAADKMSSELQKSEQVVKERLHDDAKQSKTQVQSLEDTIEELKSELAALQNDKLNALKAKEHLLEEVNLAVDGMSEETSQLHQQLAQSQLELTSLTQDKQYLTEENSRLLERVSALEQQQDSQEKVRSTIADLLDSKNRLAYDKGHLQSRVDQLQGELESLAGARAESQQLQKINATVQAQFTKTTSELSSAKVTIQRIDRKLRQEQEASERKEKDFQLAIQARDEALQQCQRLKGQLGVMEDREKQKAASFQRSLGDAKSDQAKIGATLEGVMASHKQLQTAVESLQVELGRKDSELSTLRTERRNNQKTVGVLKREVEKLTANLVAVETAEGSQVDGLRADLDEALTERTKLGGTLDDLLQTNGTLQATVERLQGQLERRNHKYKLLQEAREKERSCLEDQLRTSAERLQSLQLQTASRRDASLRSASKEVGQLQRTNQDLTARVKELSQTNAELRAKVASLEETSGKQRDRIGSLKSQLDSSIRLKKTNSEMTEKIRVISRQLSEMESAKREYARKNSEQAKTISNFVQQVAGLQSDLQTISSAQASLSSSSRKKSHELGKEREKLQQKAQDLQDALIKLQGEKTDAQEKLIEASNESMQITANLQEAQSWFKARHDALQQELVEARQRQAQLEKSNVEQQQQLLQEKMKAAEQTQRARDMIKASRQALTRLARQAEDDQRRSKSQMTTMANRLQAEKDHSAFTDKKLEKFMDISGQYIEELALQLDRHRSSQGDVTT